ncbi:uncharacterized protein B0I36DRAFT_247834 [Microdochium trichocladiopsis]|uniref:Uncharacterized protein n=1 Tax=Microdochium trichocladiopsis TaxID=1682393 RepID=A0A9P8Y0J2_9PEZI|nr:uncharacterized protein B0I36DRAFT_247834 [Microdochium trichocladiopsis]KAH7026271.1 hypothetical protein B0I36DRAFT_247834 [Microdochium trichocladiopsis]
MVFCAYCGKSFTRKEHLERHIPSHTNVKPHRCSACQLSFARRDLLQRHHSTYHEARDPMEPSPGGVPTIAGKTPIACLNCAQAKTGCDKRVPCSRCAEKNLDCAARFARRSSKAALRAAQAAAATKVDQPAVSSSVPTSTALGVNVPSPTHPTEVDHESHPSGSATIDPACMGMNHTHQRHGPQNKIVGTETDNAIMIDPLLQSHGRTSSQSSPDVSHLSSEAVSPAQLHAHIPDEVISSEGDFMLQDGNFQDMLLWQDIHMDFDMYGGNPQFGRQDMSVSAIPELNDIASCSSSEKMISSRGSVSTHTRSTSIASHRDADTGGLTKEPLFDLVNEESIPEFEAVIAAEAGWSLARCNTPIYSSTCPRTGIVHLECLEQKSKQEGTWDALDQYLNSTKRSTTDHAPVIPMSSRSRDRMLAITQTFLHKALEIHRGGLHRQHNTQYSNASQPTFLVLPPSNVVEYFLRSYVGSTSFFYSLVSTGCVDPNDLLSHSTASILLLLLMIAQGASTVPTAEARALSAGLIETCRISLFDIIEKDIEMSADLTALQCAALFTMAGAWSGDKWLMDIAMGQRGMYLSMLKHAGMFDAQPSMIPALNQPPTNVELQWRSWLQRETQNRQKRPHRLTYNWVMIDQELSLFHDIAPMLSVSDLLAPLPGPELLWMSANADQWFAAMQSMYGCTANVNPQLLTSQSLSPSLFDLFQDFLHDSMKSRPTRTTPQQLRLLLHPLQSLLCHLRQMLSCFSDVLGTRHISTRTVTKASTQLRLEEVQALLQRWYELSIEHQNADQNCCVTKTNLVLYHLISLNAVTNFPEVERLARRDCFDGSYWELSLRHKRCIFQREEAIFHCGQVLRLLRALPSEKRPSWWSVALYRATLILWADSISRLDPSFQVQQKGTAAQEHAARGEDSRESHPDYNPVAVAVDQVTPEDPLVAAYLWNGSGFPVLTNPDGGVLSIENPGNILGYAIRTVQTSPASRLGDGIRRKLLTLGRNWQTDGLTDGHNMPTTTIGSKPTVVLPPSQAPMMFPFHYPQTGHAHGVATAHTGQDGIL